MKFIRYSLMISLGMIIFAISIYSYGKFQTPKYSDVGIVLGNQVVSDTMPGDRLKARLDKAIDLYQRKIIKKILVSGGVGVEGFSEARVMANYLINYNVMAEDLYIDEHGNNTHQTSLNSRELIGSQISVVGISQNFHLMRVKMSLRNAGFKQVSVTGANFSEVRDVYSTFREIPALVKYILWKL